MFVILKDGDYELALRAKEIKSVEENDEDAVTVTMEDGTEWCLDTSFRAVMHALTGAPPAPEVPHEDSKDNPLDHKPFQP